MDKTTLTLLSQILIVAGVLAIGTLPFIEQYQARKSNRQSALQQRYYEIQRSIVSATTLWELSRLFFSQNELLARVGADQKAIEQNRDQYRYCIMGAVTFARNAAFGFAETAEEMEASRRDNEQRNQPEEQMVQRLREQYPEYHKRAFERGNQFVREIRSLESSISTARIWKTWLNIIGLVLNVVGLAVGIRASML